MNIIIEIHCFNVFTSWPPYQFCLGVKVKSSAHVSPSKGGLQLTNAINYIHLHLKMP